MMKDMKVPRKIGNFDDELHRPLAQQQTFASTS